MSQKIIVRNNNSKQITINDLGQVIMENETIDLSQQYTVHKLIESNSLKELIEDKTLTLNNGKKDLSVNDALKYLTFSTLYSDKISKRLSTIFGVIALLLTFYEIYLSFQYNQYKTKEGQSNLTAQINEVEVAINNMRKLEFFLTKTKEEMKVTNEAKIRIENEYNKSKELEKLSKEQIEAISIAVNKRTRYDMVISHLSAFIWGIFSSLIASLIYGKIKHNS